MLYLGQEKQHMWYQFKDVSL